MEKRNREWEREFTCFPREGNKEGMTANSKAESDSLALLALANLAHEPDSIGL
jgi:hypothetical protein